MEFDEDTQGLIEYQAGKDQNRVEWDRDGGVTIVPELLPERLFATDRYPVKGRINSYSKPEYLLDIVDVLQGTTELEYLQNSPLGSLFELPIRKCSLSGKLVHNILCRSLVTAKEHELWFVFGGHPFRFSLREFGLVTGLPCFPYPPAEEIKKAQTAGTSEPFWKTLFGNKKMVTINDIVRSLKVDSRKPPDGQMPGWKKLRLALVVIVEGILICDSQPVRASKEVVEMVRNLGTFFSYPWGRESFNLTMRMVKVGSKVDSVESLVAKMKQSHVATHGFILSLQLLILHCIPLLETYLPDNDDEQTFTDRSVFQLAKLKSFHNSNILEAENNPELEVISILETEEPIDESQYGWEDEVVDSGVEYIMSLLEKGVTIGKEIWHGGYDGLPIMSIAGPKIVKKEKKLPIPRKRSTKEEVIEEVADDGNAGDDNEAVRDDEPVVGEQVNKQLDGHVVSMVDKKLKAHKKELMSMVDKKLLILRTELLRKIKSGNGQGLGKVGIKKCGVKNFEKSEGKKVQACLTRKREGIRIKKVKGVVEESGQVDVDDYFGVNEVLKSMKVNDGGQTDSTRVVEIEDDPTIQSGYDDLEKTKKEHEIQDDTTFYRESENIDETGGGLHEQVHGTEYEVENNGQEREDENDEVEKSDDVEGEERSGDGEDDETSVEGDCNETDGDDGDENEAKEREFAEHTEYVPTANEVVDINTEKISQMSIENEKTVVDNSESEMAVDNFKDSEKVVDNAESELVVDNSKESEQQKSTEPADGADVHSDEEDEEKRSTEPTGGVDVNGDRNDEEKEGSQSNEEEVPMETETVVDKKEEYIEEDDIGKQVVENVKGRRGIKRLEDNNETLPSKRVKKAPTRYGATPDNKRQPGGTELYTPFRKVDVAKKKKFLAKLSSYKKKEYIIDGHPVPNTFFSDIMTPKHWVDTPEMEAMLSLVWRKLGESFNNSRIAVLDTWFTSMLCNEYPRFKKWNKSVPFQWNSVCKNYVRGHVPSRSGKMMWFEDVDTIYLPMNWRKGHWVCLVVLLKEGKIDILDPLISGNDLKKVKRIMNPIVEMLPGLIRDEVTSPTAYPRPETFTFERVVAISQNERTGDCGPFAVKLIELHGQGLGVDGITDEMVDNFRLIYAMDVYEEFVGAISN